MNADINGFIEEARKQGYTDDEITQYLGQSAPNYVPQANDYFKQNPATEGWNGFLSSAKQLADQNDFPLSVLVGQAALESARGQHAPGNNFFGIKGQGNNGSNDLATKEATSDGQYYDTNSSFAAYKSPEDSIQAYINLIKNHYQDAYAYRKDPVQMLQAIRGGGYATSPTYVTDVMNTPEFKQYLGMGGQ